MKHNKLESIIFLFLTLAGGAVISRNKIIELFYLFDIVCYRKSSDLRTGATYTATLYGVQSSQINETIKELIDTKNICVEITHNLEMTPYEVIKLRCGWNTLNIKERELLINTMRGLCNRNFKEINDMVIATKEWKNTNIGEDINLCI